MFATGWYVVDRRMTPLTILPSSSFLIFTFTTYGPHLSFTDLASPVTRYWCRQSTFGRDRVGTPLIGAWRTILHGPWHCIGLDALKGSSARSCPCPATSHQPQTTTAFYLPGQRGNHVRICFPGHLPTQSTCAITPPTWSRRDPLSLSGRRSSFTQPVSSPPLAPSPANAPKMRLAARVSASVLLLPAPSLPFSVPRAPRYTSTKRRASLARCTAHVHVRTSRSCHTWARTPSLPAVQGQGKE